MTLTVFRAGNSEVVAIPRPLLKELGIKNGDKVELEKSPDNTAIVIKKQTSPIGETKKSDQEFAKWWQMFLRENGGILDDLA